MRRISLENPYGDDKVHDACGVFGIMDTTGECFHGHDVVTGLANMTERGNGLGSGYAIYGCYPEYADCYAFHVMYTNADSRSQIETRLKRDFIWIFDEEVPHNPTPELHDAPLIWRYFLRVDEDHPQVTLLGELEYIVSTVMDINVAGLGAYIYSSGRNMGSFKGVGFPQQIADYFGVQDYTGYIWSAHNRFPTNTPGWWGGAHPFGLLDWTVVHNGEISSYGANRRFLEMRGYHCTMTTDTEVMAYAADYLMRRHALPVEIAVKVMAAPLWDDIERMDEDEQALYRTLRQVYGGLLFTGPFTIILARAGEMIGLTDRLRLRPIIAASSGDRLYISSEEAPIRLVSPELDRLWSPVGGEPIIGRLGDNHQLSAISKGQE
ncbi:MAG: glutamine amidotransferase family protein [Anaerolineae bacterium]|nr:glutamine amidotransferase family protein [Anaerolineae bacterium]